MNGVEMEQIRTGLIMRELIRENFRFSVQLVYVLVHRRMHAREIKESKQL